MTETPFVPVSFTEWQIAVLLANGASYTTVASPNRELTLQAQALLFADPEVVSATLLRRTVVVEEERV